MRSVLLSYSAGAADPGPGRPFRRAILAALSGDGRDSVGALRGRTTERARIGGGRPARSPVRVFAGGPCAPRDSKLRGPGPIASCATKAPRCGAVGGGRSRTRTWDLFLIREAL